MIPEAEIRRVAGSQRADAMVMDLDYSLSWFLAGLAATATDPDILRFKGGTCLRKCYFAHYRFSEDLDFTAAGFLRPADLESWLARVTHWSAERDGPDFASAPARVEVVEDDYGSESYQARVYYRGPLRWGGTPRAIRLDITRDERLTFPPADRSLIHAYSDAASFRTTFVRCYSREEIMAEKLRAVCGQRRYAISRDVYDLHRLVNAGVAVQQVATALPAKFAARGVDIACLSEAWLASRKTEMETDWNRNLSYLLADAQPGLFVDAWQTVLEAVAKAHQFLADVNTQ